MTMDGVSKALAVLLGVVYLFVAFGLVFGLLFGSFDSPNYDDISFFEQAGVFLAIALGIAGLFAGTDRAGKGFRIAYLVSALLVGSVFVLFSKTQSA